MLFPNLPDLPFKQAFKLRDQLLINEGWAFGMRHALGLILEEARGLVLSKEQQDGVAAACGWDVRKWVRKALTVSSTDDLFVEDLA